MGKVIMVVDDEIDSVYTIRTVLEKAGYSVVTASNGDECLKKLETGEKPELILMDIMMPGTSVKEVVGKIKDIKILYFSSVMMGAEEKAELEGAGNVVGFVSKSLDVNKFVERIKSIIG